MKLFIPHNLFTRRIRVLKRVYVDNFPICTEIYRPAVVFLTLFSIKLNKSSLVRYFSIFE